TAAQAVLISKVILFGALRQAFADLPDGGSYIEARDILAEGDKLLAEIKADVAALAQPEPAPTPPVALPAVVDAEATPELKRHALEAADNLSRYAAAPFFPDTEKRGKVRATSAEWWDGLAELIEETQPLIARALRECGRPHPAPASASEPDAEEQVACAEAVLESFAVRFGVENCDWKCIGDGIEAVVAAALASLIAPGSSSLASGASTEVQAPIPQASGDAVAWVDWRNLKSAQIARERGGSFDSHVWSEEKTSIHATPLYVAPQLRLTHEQALAVWQLGE